MSKTRKLAADHSRGRLPWADQTIPIAGVPSGVYSVRDDRGRLVEIIVPFMARRSVKGSEVPAGYEAVHLIALAAVDYVNALRKMLSAAPIDHEDSHANMLLCALASLEGALFEMDRTAFAAVGEAPRRADGKLALSAHDAVLEVLSWSVTWALRALSDLEKQGETPLKFFMRLDPRTCRDAAVVVSRLRGVVDQIDPRAEIADWVSAKVLLNREVAQLRAKMQVRQRLQVPPLGMNLRQQILWVCRDGDAKGLRKWTEVASKIGNTSEGGSSVRRQGNLLVRSGHLEKTLQGYRTTPAGLALLPKSVPEEHTS